MLRVLIRKSHTVLVSYQCKDIPRLIFSLHFPMNRFSCLDLSWYRIATEIRSFSLFLDRKMHIICCFILLCFTFSFIEGFPSSTPLSPRSVFSGANKVRSRFRRRELVQEEVRKTMLSYMTSLKGEITDVVLEEMIDYYNSQTSKLYRLEKELGSLKNSSIPLLSNGTTITDLVQRMSIQQRSFAKNISQMEYKIKNLTTILNDLLTELQKPVQHVRRLATGKKDWEEASIPTGKLLIFLSYTNKVIV